MSDIDKIAEIYIKYTDVLSYVSLKVIADGKNDLFCEDEARRKLRRSHAFAKKILALFDGYKSPDEVDTLRFKTTHDTLKNAMATGIVLDPSAHIICPHCGGSGEICTVDPEYFTTTKTPCPKCYGHGKMMKKCDCIYPHLRVKVEGIAGPCPHCKGDGLIQMIIQDLIDKAWEEKGLTDES